MNFNQWKETVVKQTQEAGYEQYLPNDQALNLLWFQQGYTPEAVVGHIVTSLAKPADEECTECQRHESSRCTR